MKKNLIAIIICLLVLGVTVYYVFSLRIAYNNNELLKTSYAQRDYKSAYKSLFIKSPAIEERPYLGFQNAPLTIIVVVDFKSELAKSFYDEKIPEIEDSYINTGQARLYHKYYITKDELDNRTNRFVYASASRCYNEFSFNKTIAFNQALFNTPEEKIYALADEFSIAREEFINCVKNSDYKELYQDMLETEEFIIQSPSIYLGVNGQDNILIVGNPNMELIQRRMRTQQTKVGI